jgi:serine protease Do
MNGIDNPRGLARLVSVRSGGRASAAAALALVTGLSGAAALLHEPSPASAEISATAPQTITPSTFTDLARVVSPAVVAISVSGEGGGGARDFERMVPPDSPFREFFERFFEGPEGFRDFERRGEGERDVPRRPRIAQGSGFIISADGYIVTNEHVVDSARSISVVTNDGAEFEAKLVGQDERTDLAVLKIEPEKELPFVRFAEREAEVGEWVMAVGNPFGLGGTVTTGIVSASGRNIGSGSYNDYIQIDAAVNRGNSGGPSFDLEGEVIGVNTAIFSPNGGNIGIGFAIPATTAKNIVEQLIDNGQITRGWLGVSIQTVTPDIAESVGLDAATGTIVAEVFGGSPADKAKIVTGDVVLEVNGHAIDSSRDLARTIADLLPGATVKLLLHREGRKETVEVELGTMPADPRVASTEPDVERGTALDRLAELGLEVEPASKSENDPDARGVVVTSVGRDSEAESKGISRGDRILRVAGVEVNTPEQLDSALAAARDDGLSSVLALVRSRNGQRFVTFELART